MLSYETQLDLKRSVVVRAYQLFSGKSARALTILLCGNILSDLPQGSVPTVLPTAPSPLQYGYRTKITPHFEAPVKAPRRGKKPRPNVETQMPDTVPIGFNMSGKKDVLDIEVGRCFLLLFFVAHVRQECPIATSVINRSLGPLRRGVIE